MSNKINLEQAIKIANYHTRVHISGSKVEALESWRDKLVAQSKPHGLWYGIGASWLDWCGSEMPQWVGGYLYRVSLDPDKLLRLTTTSELHDFTDEYGSSQYRGLRDNIDTIDWPAVAEKYSGIEIAPYQWSLRMENKFFWYYGWDVASGVVWDPYDAMVMVEKVGFIRGRSREDYRPMDRYNYAYEGEQEDESHQNAS